MNSSSNTVAFSKIYLDLVIVLNLLLRQLAINYYNYLTYFNRFLIYFDPSLRFPSLYKLFLTYIYVYMTILIIYTVY